MNPQNLNQPEPTVINPNIVDAPAPPLPSATDMFQPIATPAPVEQPTYNQPYNPPQPAAVPPQPITNYMGNKPKRGSKKPLIIIAVILIIFVGVTIAAVLFSGTKKDTKTETATQNTAPQGPQPAQAIDVEQANNSISQDVSGHDNTKDFPTDELDDKTLGL